MRGVGRQKSLADNSQVVCCYDTIISSYVSENMVENHSNITTFLLESQHVVVREVKVLKNK